MVRADSRAVRAEKKGGKTKLKVVCGGSEIDKKPITQASWGSGVAVLGSPSSLFGPPLPCLGSECCPSLQAASICLLDPGLDSRWQD